MGAVRLGMGSVGSVCTEGVGGCSEARYGVCGSVCGEVVFGCSEARCGVCSGCV